MKLKNTLSKKPPLGICPEEIWVNQRVYELMRALTEYKQAGLRPNVEWFSELKQHLNGRHYRLL